MDGNVSATAVKFAFSASQTTNSTAGFSFYGGFYSLNANTLSLATALTSAWTWSSNAASSNLSTIATAWGGYSQVRFYQIASNVNLTPGEWWFGYNYVTGGSLQATFFGIGSSPTIVNSAGSTTVASSPSMTNAMVPFWGRSNATTGAVVTSVANTATGFVYNEVAALKKPWILLTAI